MSFPEPLVPAELYTVQLLLQLCIEAERNAAIVTWRRLMQSAQPIAK